MVLVICLTVECDVGAQTAYPFNLSHILRKVRLHGQTVVLPHGIEGAHEGIGTTGHETGRENGVGALKMAGRQPTQGFADTLLGLLYQGSRGKSVHIHPTDQGNQPRLLQGVHQQKGRIGVAGTLYTGTRGGAFAQGRDELTVCLLGVDSVGKACLLGKGGGIQPIDQFQIHTRATQSKLGRVDMQFYQPRHDQTLAVVHHGKMTIFGGQGGKNTATCAAGADHVAFGRRQPAVSKTVDDVSFEDKTFHTHSFAPLGNFDPRKSNLINCVKI